jgi:hypothetical protein
MPGWAELGHCAQQRWEARYVGPERIPYQSGLCRPAGGQSLANVHAYT